MKTQTFRSPLPTRRDFLKNAGTASAAALTLGFDWAGTSRRAAALAAAAPGAAPFAPNAFLRIGSDNSVTVISKHLEMGQGSYTGIATIVAEELDADWALVRVESAPADAKRYANLVFGTIQGTGGSSAMANSWAQLREAGAKARAMLLAAAAKEWHVPATELTTQKGVVYHAASKRQASYGSLVKTAAALPVPETVAFKDPKRFQADRQPPAARRRGVENRWHRAIHLGCGVARHAGGAAQAAAAIRRDGQILRCCRSCGGAGRGQGGAGAARRRRDCEELLGSEARPGRPHG